MSKVKWNFEIMQDESAYLTPEQVSELIGKIEVQPYNLIVRLLWRTGARITEVLNIKKIDINLALKEVTIKTLKLKRKDKKRPPRKVPLADEALLADLSDWAGTMRPNDPLFGGVNRFNVYYRIRQAGKSIGLEEVGERGFMHPHILRHSFAIYWVRQGLPLAMLKTILGHTSIETTNFYQRFNTKDLHDYIDKMWR